MLYSFFFFAFMLYLLVSRISKGAQGKQMSKDDWGLILLAAPWILALLYILITFK